MPKEYPAVYARKFRIEVQKRLELLTRQVVSHSFVVAEEMVRLTPIIGFAPLDSSTSAEILYDRVLAARTHAALQLDLEPVLYHPHGCAAASR
jgi:hypothetical protein